MDQVTPFYDNTPADGFFAREQNAALLSDAEIIKLTQGLLASMDLSTLLDTAFNSLKDKLPINSLQLCLPDMTLSAGNTRKANQQLKKSFDLSHSQITSHLSYQLKSELSGRQWPLLLELHTIVKRPLQLALDFYSVKQLAMRDPLTGLGNRASYQEQTLRHISAARRHQQMFSILVFDLDKFKQVNDSCGHPEGDKVLIAIANILNSKMRDTDYAFRLGGDEFCCLLAESNKQACQRLAERVQKAVERDTLLDTHGVSCSIGSANYQQGDDVNSLFARADAALYLAKQAGRDRHIAA